jgi:hypothetical protein
MRALRSYFALFILSFLFFSADILAQCNYSMRVLLETPQGGRHRGQKVIFTSRADGAVYSGETDLDGKVMVLVPCNEMFEMSISDYTDTRIVQSGDENGTQSLAFSYDLDMKKNEELMAMNEQEMAQVDKTAKALPDSNYIPNGIKPPTPSIPTHFVLVTLRLTNLDKNPLAFEEVSFIGTKRNKKFIGLTDSKGNLQVYLPKGDVYTFSFKYNKDYNKFEYRYTNGLSTSLMAFSYMGTTEYLRRKKIMDERAAAEAKRVAEEKKRFEADCKRLGISVEEGYKREFRHKVEKIRSLTNLVISSVLNRNKWKQKLVVCDLTGSMDPYNTELSVWYQLHISQEKDIQFVFFNDGDEKPDQLKKIGSTGGIYYSGPASVQKIDDLMAHVKSMGSGGDAPENNMEALIKGVNMAKFPFSEIVMIVDNQAPVKDLALLKEFHKPVHIVLCGGYGREILPDYLLIAWKTKGSIHTIEEDITKIARMSEGQEIKISGITYRIMGEEFVRITKI